MSFEKITTDHMQTVQGCESLIKNRAALADMLANKGSEVTILVQAYHQLEKTKRCVNSILKYTDGIDYNLILVDNGSNDGTYEFFASVPYAKKRVIQISKNIGSSYPFLNLKIEDFGRYICLIPADLIVTPHWMDNLLTCIKSDERIGMVNPLSNHLAWEQNADVPYSSIEEMERMAEGFNRSDPRLWAEHLWFVTLGTLYRKEVFLDVGWPNLDVGFMHYCADIDVCMSVRRAGYRLIVAGDTWVCHDHPLEKNVYLEDIEQKKKSSWKAFAEKYHGLGMDDGTNFISTALESLPGPRAKTPVRVLGINTRCGQPLLDTKNWLRTFGLYDVSLSAITADSEYWEDLNSICDGKVVCGSVESALAELPIESFDYVIADQPFNQYPEPERALSAFFRFCKKGGIVLCKLRNTASFRMYLNLLGEERIYDKKRSWNISSQQAQDLIKEKGNVIAVERMPFGMEDSRMVLLNELRPRGVALEDADALYHCAAPLEEYMSKKEKRLLREMLTEEPGQERWQQLIWKMTCKDYVYLVEKGGSKQEKRQPLNILFIAEHLGDGAGKAIGGMALLSQRAGDRCRILLLDEPKKLKHVERCVEAGIEILKSASAEEAIREADVVVINWWGGKAMSEFLREFPKVPCRIALWAHKNGFFDPPLSNGLVNLCDQFLVTSCLSWQHPGWQIARIVFGFGDFDPDVIPKKQNYHISQGEFRIGYIGMPSYKRFPPDAVEYFKAVLKRIPEAKFIMAGEYSAEFYRDLETEGLLDKVNLLGWVPNAGELLQSFDVFGYLLRRDTFATTENSVLEAMAAGVPVVMPREPIGKYVVNEVNGMLFDGPEEYADAMYELYQSEALRRAKGMAGRRHIAYYSATENVNRFQNACEEMLQREKYVHRFDSAV